MNNSQSFLRRPEVYLLENSSFPKTSEILNSGSALKYFLNFVKYMKVKGPIDFAYVSPEGPLIANLSLQENLFLEAVPLSLSTSKEFSLINYLKKAGNVSLLKLYTKIKNLDSLPGEARPSEKKLVSLLQGLLKSSHFLFLEGPEAHLEGDGEILTDLRMALHFEAGTRERIIIISSSNQNHWAEILTQIVSRRPNGTYHIEKVPPRTQDLNRTPALTFHNF